MKAMERIMSIATLLGVLCFPLADDLAENDQSNVQVAGIGTSPWWNILGIGRNSRTDEQIMTGRKVIHFPCYFGPCRQSDAQLQASESTNEYSLAGKMKAPTAKMELRQVNFSVWSGMDFWNRSHYETVRSLRC